MIHKPENFINRLRWQVYFYANRDNEKSKNNSNFKSFGFESEHATPSYEDLKPGASNLFVAVYHLWSYSVAPYHLTLRISFVRKRTVHKGYRHVNSQI